MSVYSDAAPSNVNVEDNRRSRQRPTNGLVWLEEDELIAKKTSAKREMIR